MTDLPGQGTSEAPFERRVLQLALLAGLPGAAIAVALLLFSDLSGQALWLPIVATLAVWIGAALLLKNRVVRPIQTLSNLLGALREGDVSIKARGARSDDALGLALLEINTLSETLRQQRVGAAEATALLRGVMAEIDVAVLAFDSDRRLQLVNKAGERLLGQPAARMLGSLASEYELDGWLEGDTPRTVTNTFHGSTGRWELRRTTFRQDGLPHQLIVLSDLSRALREEERLAWQRLIRVLSHEINNSLTPIQSIAGSLIDLLRRDPEAEDLDEDLAQGLGVIRARSGALSRFMAAYARLARLPAPVPHRVAVIAWVRRIVSLEPRLAVQLVDSPPIELYADEDQLDQLLINLIRNAVDASLETGGEVEVGWRVHEDALEIFVADEGPGLADTTNLFVPFFTTKPNGSGIGLALSRQIAEAHGGTLTLENRPDRTGCRASLILPLVRIPEDREIA